MPQATSNPVEVTYLPITNSDDMHAAQKAAIAIGYYGTITTNAAGEWMLSLTGNQDLRMDAYIGQVLIWNGTSLTVLSADDFAARYTPL